MLNESEQAVTHNVSGGSLRALDNMTGLILHMTMQFLLSCVEKDEVTGPTSTDFYSLFEFNTRIECLNFQSTHAVLSLDNQFVDYYNSSTISPC